MTHDERLARAVELREGGQLDQARELLLALRTEFPADAHIAVQTAWVHDSLGLEEEAVSHYRAAIAGDLSDQELRGALLGLGSTLRTLGRDAEADDIFRLGVERFPDYRPLRVFHAMLRYNLGEPREAIADLLRLLLESTSDATILRYRRALTGTPRTWTVAGSPERRRRRGATSRSRRRSEPEQTPRTPTTMLSNGGTRTCRRAGRQDVARSDGPAAPRSVRMRIASESWHDVVRDRPGRGRA